MYSNNPAPNTNAVVIGLDIGGANLKAADLSGNYRSIAFPMWQQHQRLSQAITDLLAPMVDQAGDSQIRLAVTLTGELADCFATRREGVAEILAQVAICQPADKTWVYATNGQFLSPKDAINDPWSVAASNWHALASWCGTATFAADVSLAGVVDIGSTTIDIIPIADGNVATAARTDRDRLQLGQLLYTGMRRTPVAAITRTLTVDGRECPVMAERFATSDDVYLLLGLVDQDLSDCDTADGRPRTLPAAHGRLARMVGEDAETLSLGQVQSLARQVLRQQAHQLSEALGRGLSPAISNFSPPTNPTLVLSGHGQPLFSAAMQQTSQTYQIIKLADCISESASRVAPALAVAHLLTVR